MGRVAAESGQSGESPSLIFPDWPRHPRVHAVSTTRRGGVSAPPLDSLNLGTHVGDALENVRRNRNLMIKAAGLPGEPAWLRQVHGARVVAAQPHQEPEADACWTNQANLPCVIMSADCLPILIADDDGTCVAAVHAGWRGLAAGVISTTVANLPASPAGLSAWLGPAISAAAFEVGPEVRAAFIQLDELLRQAFVPAQSNRWHCDLNLAALITLKRAGIDRVHGGGRCTFGEPEAFFSHRRDGRCGRMANLIWLADDT